MEQMYQMMMDRLHSCGITEVYTAFDAVPVEKKSRAMFTVLSLQNVQFGEAYPAKDGAVYPFTAEFRADLLTPMNIDPQGTMKFFFSKIVPAMLGSDCLFTGFDTALPRVDLKLRRMVYGGTFRLHGAFCMSMAPETEGEV